MRSCLIFNPTARGEKARAVHAGLQTWIGQCAVLLTTGPGHAQTLAAQAVRDGFKVIVAAGGDGTINEVVNGIAVAPGGLTGVKLGILPLGTVNVFARELGLPRGVRAAWGTIGAGRETLVDLGRAEFDSGQVRFFVQLAGAGIDSRAIELVNWKLKKKIGPLAYVVAGLQAWREPQPMIAVENGAAGELVLLGNGRYYGGSFSFFPKASLRDGLLEVCVFPKVSVPRLAQAAFGMVTGRLGQMSSAVRSQAKSVKLTSASRVMLQLDGENVGELPARLSVVPNALRVIVP
ncbi:MAG TPA: diacylglycerol kinase family protein [Verrucomicrobiae bacterium]|nr:diacylglycerol kinase family protein [Verrucomicrobiae bacterium]